MAVLVTRKAAHTPQITRCARCQRRIAWVRMTVSGKAVPIDPDPDDAGNVCAMGEPGRVMKGRVIPPGQFVPESMTRYMPHFATCPAAVRTEGGETRPPPAPTEPQVDPVQAALFDGLDP